MLGSALAVKPLLHLVDGHIEPLEKVRTAAKAIARLEEIAVASCGQPRPSISPSTTWPAPSGPTRSPTGSAAGSPGCDQLVVSEVGAVVGAHVGPGMLAVVVAPR